MYLISIGKQAARVASHLQGMNESIKVTKIGVTSEEYNICISPQSSPEDYENKTDFKVFVSHYLLDKLEEENNIIVVNVMI